MPGRLAEAVASGLPPKSPASAALPRVIAHFVGATPGSTSLRRIMRRLCDELDPAAAAKAGENIDELRAAFAKALAVKPAIIFVDALDQLDPVDHAHQLAWLPSPLPAGARVVVSTLQARPSRRSGRGCRRRPRCPCPR